MCNAFNHGAGCACGFGPPYLSSNEPLRKLRGGNGGSGFKSVIRWRDRRKWSAKSILDDQAVQEGLSELGVNRRWINSIGKKYTKAGYPWSQSRWEAMSKGQRYWAESKLLKLLGLHIEDVEQLEDIDFDIPLFRLQSPRTKKSKVRCKESLSEAQGWNIFLEVPGFALGADLSMRIEAEVKIETSENYSKIICLPVRIKRKIVNLKMGKIYIARNKMIAEAGNKKTGQLSRRIISREEFISPSPDAPMIAYYDLSQDDTEDKSVFTIGWGNEKTRQAKLSIPVPGVKIGVGVKVELESQLMLEFELEPRYQYKLYPTPEEIGISWVVEGR
jgi:hypothetical protein